MWVPASCLYHEGLGPEPPDMHLEASDFLTSRPLLAQLVYNISRTPIHPGIWVPSVLGIAD